MTNKCASSMCHFDGHDDAPVRCQAHLPTNHVQGYLRSHWMPLSGKYSSCIALEATMVIHFGVKNQVVALWNCCSKASIQKAQNRPSTQLIEATSWVERWNTTIEAEENSYFSSYQMLPMDKNRWSYQARMGYGASLGLSLCHTHNPISRLFSRTCLHTKSVDDQTRPHKKHK